MWTLVSTLTCGREIGPKPNLPFWKRALDFLERFDSENNIFHYSGYLLKELDYILEKEEFEEKKSLFESSSRFKRVGLSEEEYAEAKSIEENMALGISFYDILHILLARKTESTLITRDKEMIKAAKKLEVKVEKPEDYC